MSCKYKYYVNKAYDIQIATTSNSTSSIANLINDIGVDFIVTLTLTTNPAITTSFSISNGKIVVGTEDITVLILAGDISDIGYYNIKYEYTDIFGKDRALPPCPHRIRFYNQ